MAQYVCLPRSPGFSDTHTYSRAPDGELAFEEGVAEVDDDVEVEWLTDAYPNLVVGDDPEAAEPTEDDGEESDDADADAPFDPADETVADFEERVESGDYSDAELDALAEAEGPEDEGGRAGIHEAIAEARNGN